MENKENTSTSKTVIGIVLAILILVVAQLLALGVAELLVAVGLPIMIGNIITGVLYPIFTLAGLYLLCEKILGISLGKCKITKFSLKPVWCMAAVVMPVAVSAFFLLMKGQLIKSNMNASQMGAVIAGAVLFVGLSTGSVEEAVFRGVIMSLLENRFNRKVAIIAPSVLFGFVHIFGRKLDFLSILQLLVAGSIVGILFSLVTYESGTIWNSALMHGIWNMVIIGGVLQIGDTVSENAIYSYVLESKSFLITGGDFGIESSVVAILLYLVFTILAGFLIMKKRTLD